jgi:glycerol-3-phosphate acyltransferase PlsY
MTNLLFTALVLPLLGYLSGSLTPSIWITRMIKGVDVRDAGSGHATTTNTIRQAGFGWGALVLMVDIAKGFLPTWLALQLAPAARIVPLTAGAVSFCFLLMGTLMLTFGVNGVWGVKKGLVPAQAE